MTLILLVECGQIANLKGEEGERGGRNKWRRNRDRRSSSTRSVGWRKSLGVAFLHIRSCLQGFGKWWAPAVRRGKSGGWRRRMERRGRCGFCLLPTFQSQSWKMNRQRKINCMTFTERKGEIGGGEKGEEETVEGRRKKEWRKSKMTHGCLFLLIVQLGGD